MLIYKIAKKFYNVEVSDLYQAGAIGLIKASRKFKEEEGTNFMTFAYKYIFGEMYELTNKSRDIKLNKYYLKLYREMEKAKGYLTQKENRIPTHEEICNYLEIDESIGTDVVIMTNQMLSLDAEFDYIGKEENIDNKILINDSLESLNPLEKSVINYRFFSDLTQDETADVLGISQVKVSRVEAKSKKKIEEYIAA